VKRMLSIAFLIAGMCASLAAQNQQQRNDSALEVEKLRIQAEERARAEADQRNWETRIFPVRYIDPNQLYQALVMFRAQFSPNTQLRLISARAPKEIMPAIEDAIKRLDVPTPAINKSAELMVYVLMASDQAEPGAAMPAILQPVITQLRSVLAYKSFQLVETLLGRGTDGRRMRLAGTLQGIGLGTAEPMPYSLDAQFNIQNPDGKTPALRLVEMAFRLGGVAIATDVEIPQGQQVVVGKATMADRAFILVMSAKFAN
jgi:hypothetical protein